MDKNPPEKGTACACRQEDVARGKEKERAKDTQHQSKGGVCPCEPAKDCPRTRGGSPARAHDISLFLSPRLTAGADIYPQN